MKFLVSLALFAAAVLTAPTTTAAAEFTADVGVESAYVYRGVNLSNTEDYSLNTSFRVQDVILEGAYLRAGANTITIEDGLSAGTVRTDVGVGYARDFGRFNIDVSVNRVTNPVLYTYNFTEARVEAGFDVTNAVNVYAQVGQQIGNTTNEDTYVAVGAKVTSGNLTAGAQVAGYRYNDVTVNDTKYNNTEVFASYLVADRVSIYGKYSLGGDGRYAGQKLDSVGTVGVRVLF